MIGMNREALKDEIRSQCLEAPYDCETFSFGCGVIPFGAVQRSRPTSNGSSVVVFVGLEESTANAVVTRVGINRIR